MRKLLGVLCVAGLLVGTASAQVGRLYFDLSGNNGDEDFPRDGATAQENPVLPGGGGRLFIYWQFGHRGIDDGKGGYPADHQRILGLGVDIKIDGDAVINQAYYYNPSIFLHDWRWNVSSPNPPGPSPTFNAANVNQYGLLNHEFAVADDGQLEITDGPFGSTLLGYIDVTAVTDVSGSIRFSGNGFGIAEYGGDSSDTVYFGFGDDAVNTLTGTSTVADATIIPEPAGLMLLGLGAMALRRRR